MLTELSFVEIGEKTKNHMRIGTQETQTSA
jgi:hypothetical protein